MRRQIVRMHERVMMGMMTTRQGRGHRAESSEAARLAGGGLAAAAAATAYTQGGRGETGGAAAWSSEGRQTFGTHQALASWMPMVTRATAGGDANEPLGGGFNCALCGSVVGDWELVPRVILRSSAGFSGAERNLVKAECQRIAREAVSCNRSETETAQNRCHLPKWAHSRWWPA